MKNVFRLLPCEQDDTLGRSCAANKVAITDVWIPVQLLRPPRKKDDSPIAIPPGTAVVLLNHTTGCLVTRRSDILSLVPVLFASEQNFCIPPSTIPRDCTLFARAAKGMSNKRVPAGISIMHRSITAEQALAEGSCIAESDSQSTASKKKVKLERDVATGSVVTVATTTDTAVERANKRRRSDALFEESLHSVLATMRGGGGTHRDDIIIKETLENLHRVRSAPPLHFVTHNKRVTSLNVMGLVWHIPDERVIYRIFRQYDKGENCSAFAYTDSSRTVAAFMIDDVLLRRECLGAGAGGESTKWSVTDARLPATAGVLAERGYRIVLVDHYPSLHHGNLYALESRLQPIVELCKQHFTWDVTVVLSVVSHISAASRRDMAPFVLPNSGLWDFFTTQLNGGLRPDGRSILVGPRASAGEEVRKFSCQGVMEAEFAKNCGLRYCDAATVVEGQI
uniref:Uncharacterized protein TCIL3000_10_13830 n=1 Tax=Trypanosoma congolense (strain IL3000) TaxID=1068625 RepID=G0UYY0_TRYCI|nr:unnamed protein product [Trypanosoma congolense IL3000]